MTADKEKKHVVCPVGDSPSLFGESLSPVKKRKGVPLRLRNAKVPHTRLLVFYAQVHYKTHTRDVQIKDYKQSSRNLKAALKRGISESEIMDAITFYHKQDDEWAIGHNFEKFMYNLDIYIDRAKKVMGTLDKGNRAERILAEIERLEAMIKDDPALECGNEGIWLNNLRVEYGAMERRKQRGRRNS